jgi:hypothetical protein
MAVTYPIPNIPIISFYPSKCWQDVIMEKLEKLHIIAVNRLGIWIVQTHYDPTNNRTYIP